MRGMPTRIAFKTTPASPPATMGVSESVGEVINALNNAPTGETWVKLTVSDDDRDWAVKPNMVIAVEQVN
jgi:hypothetical protein